MPRSEAHTRLCPTGSDTCSHTRLASEIQPHPHPTQRGCCPLRPSHFQIKTATCFFVLRMLISQMNWTSQPPRTRVSLTETFPFCAQHHLGSGSGDTLATSLGSLDVRVHRASHPGTVGVWGRAVLCAGDCPGPRGLLSGTAGHGHQHPQC